MPNINKQELEIITNLIEQEIVVVKKYKLYSIQSKDPQLKIKMEQIASRHQKHCIDLLNQLN